MSRKKKWTLAILGLAAVMGVALALLIGHAWEVVLGPEGHYFDSAGVRIHYTDEGQGTPVLLVHGLANPAHLQWRRNGQIAALATAYRVIALDNRGHGRSGKPHDPSQYGLEMVGDLVRLLDHLQIEKAHVVGYSMGGFITLKMQTLYPGRFLSAAPCAAGWEETGPAQWEFSESVAKALEVGEVGPLRERLGIVDSSPSWWERFNLGLAMTYFNDPRALAAVARGSRQLTLTEEALRANTVPTLTIIGSEDGLLHDARALAARMSQHELHVIEGKNHVNTDGCPAFMEVLQAFLAEHTPDVLEEARVH